MIRAHVLICAGTGCTSSGSAQVSEALERELQNKGLTEEVILKGAMDAFNSGWNKVKLYFMLGLPTETEADIEGIAVLSDKIAREYYTIPKEQRNGKVSIVSSTSFFVPKPFTPFLIKQLASDSINNFCFSISLIK